MVHTNEIVIEGNHSDGWQFMNADRVPFRSACYERMDYDLAVFALGTRINYYRANPDAFQRERSEEQQS